MKRTSADDALRCSFCQKTQEVVGKLVSSPSDYPRAYICNECIAVCYSILEDDRVRPPTTQPIQLVHRVVNALNTATAAAERLEAALRTPPPAPLGNAEHRALLDIIQRLEKLKEALARLQPPQPPTPNTTP